ncbi:MAG: diaminopimelate decarboxylase [Chloroflexi bacterium]|nr:diaminopimelate decarboxylase [Chloroflexota bacterium]
MTAFHYQSGQLHCDGVPISRMVGEVGTPFYVYSAARVRNNLRRLTSAFAPLRPRICYSIKANSNLAILRLLNEEGAGFDIVSGGELYRALTAGVDPAQIVFAGVGKTRAELEFGVEAGVAWFNVESAGEVERLNEVAGAQGRTANVALRLRPGVEADTHRHIATGGASSKFGMRPAEGLELIRRASDFPHLRLRAVHIHIGSQLADASATLAALDTVLDFISAVETFRQNVSTLNLGGGFPIPYREDQAIPSIENFAAPIISRLQSTASHLQFIIEPGRYLVADAGALVLKVEHVKEVDGERVVVMNGGMNALLRPALYDAYHRVVPLAAAPTSDISPLTSVVGPICESADVLARGRSLPPLAPGDSLALLDAGAYGFTMASNYNSHPRPAEVLVEGDSFQIIRRHETYADLTAAET